MEIGKLITKFQLDSKQFIDGLSEAQKQAQSKTSSIGSILKSAAKVGITALAGLAVSGIGLVTTAFVKGVSSAKEWGEELDKLGDLTGQNSNELAGLNLAAQRVGLSTEQLTSSMGFLTRGLKDSKGGLGPTGLSLKKLGISALDASGNIKPATQIMQEVADKLATLPEGLDKSSILMDIFGKSGAEMGDTLNAVAGQGLSNFNAEAQKLGLNFTPQQTQSVIDFGKATEQSKQIFQGISSTIGISLLPILTPLIERFNNFAVQVMPLVQSAMSSVSTFLTETFLPKLDTFTTWFSETGLPAIQGFISGTSTLSWSDVISWIDDGKDQISKKLNEWKDSETIKTTVKSFGTSVGTGIIDAIKGVFIEKTNEKNLVQAISDYIMQVRIDLTDLIFTMGAEFVAGLVDGVLKSLGVPEKFRIPISKGVADGLKNGLDTALTIISPATWGQKVVEGIRDGISNWKIVTEAIGKLFNSVKTQVSQLMLMHSPSRVAMDWGKNINLGLAQGLDTYSYQPVNSMYNTIQALNPDANEQTKYLRQLANKDSGYDQERFSLIIRDAVLQGRA
jgi:TP901 family phage tail tape measure protein